MKPGDFVAYVEHTGVGGVEKPGRITEVIGKSVHITLFEGSQWIVGIDHIRPIPLEAAYSAIEEEIARVEARSAARIRDLRSTSRAVFRDALKAGR